jgi:hypothetical protein
MGIGSSKYQPYQWECSHCKNKNGMANQDCIKCGKHCPDSEWVQHFAAAREAEMLARWG